MKIISISRKEIDAVEKKAINSGTPVELLVERAAKGIASFVLHFAQENKLPKKLLVLAGKGNNGADGYAAGKLLLKEGFEVTCFEVLHPDKGTLTEKKKQEFTKAGGLFTTRLEDEFPCIILDAIFGTGFQDSKPIDESVEACIKKVRSVPLPVISIDTPSGLNIETGKAPCAIIATVTLAIETPKIGFFINDGFKHIGALQILPIGLNPIEKPTFSLLEVQDVIALLPPILRTRHKYDAGHVVGIAGSRGMCGAALMASFSAMKTGSGIMHLVHDARLTQEISGTPWEIIRVPVEDAWDDARLLMKKASSCFIGPGIGKNDFSRKALDEFIATSPKKMVIDADAITLFSENKEKIPENAVVTPHRAEMARLLHKEPTLGIDFLLEVRAFSEKNKVHIALKGAPTFLFSPGEPITISAVGDPGMATAGTGDVLTGIIASFMSQGLSPLQAMRLGVFVHGLAGVISAHEETSYCMTATSLIRTLPLALQRLMRPE